ncbi:MAG: NAD(P)H-dependent oxidoreductase [Rhizobiaceae bacterium]|jgi:NAD(P)H-dependent FMN reductase|nr:NAD(P)H-dependent oxidoreductase [Rhizobiaceae bacterium]
MPPKILVFAGSNRTGAYSGRLAAAAVTALAAAGAAPTRIALADYPLPIMDEDLEKAEGIPENAYRLGRLIAAHDGLLICSPEYNSSIPPLLKNTIDWVSRITKDGGRPFKPYQGRVAALCSSSPGAFAGIRGLYHLRSVCMNVGLTVITEQCSVPAAHEAFDEDGVLKNPRSQAALDTVAQVLTATCRALARPDLA